MTADSTGIHPAGVYWPNGDLIDAEPSVRLHRAGPVFAVVELSSRCTVHIHAPAQARAIIAAFAKAIALLEPPENTGHAEHYPEAAACSRCGATDRPLLDGQCQSTAACERRQQSRDAEAAQVQAGAS